MEILDKIQINAGIVSLQSAGILRMEVTKKDEITIPDVVEFIDTVEKIGGGKSFCNLIIINDFVEIDIETRKFSASEANKYTIAEALILKSNALKIVGNFYIGFYKPKRPTKLFTNENEAVLWLNTFL